MLTVSSLLNQLRDDLRGDTERGKLVRSAGMTAGIKIGATLLAFGASLLYARALGPHDYGLYTYVIAWVAILTIPAGLGLPQYLVREGAKAPHSLNWMRRWADKRVLIAGLIAAALLGCAFFIPAAAGARWLFVIVAPLPLLNGLSGIRSALLQAHGKIVQSQWPQFLLAPFIVLTLLAWMYLEQGAFRADDVVVITLAAALLPIMINAFQLRRIAQRPTNDHFVSLRVYSALPFMWLGGMYLLISRADLIILGTLRGAHDVGIYAVAARAAEFVPFFLVAANTVIAPRIAHLFHKGDLALLQRLLTGATRRAFTLSIPVALFFIIAARSLLSYLYGADYAEGAAVLQILASALLIVVASGPVGTILNMTGYERLAAFGVGLSVLLSVALNAALIPMYGIKGAAIATGISLVFRNILLWHWVRSRLGLRPSVLGI